MAVFLPSSSLFYASVPKASTAHTHNCPVHYTRNPRRQLRRPLGRGRILSTEAILAIQALKRASRSDPSSISSIVSTSFSRLIKLDYIAAMNEILRQDRCSLALHLFSAARSETWYRTDLKLYARFAQALGRNRLTEDIDRLISMLESEGPIPNDDAGVGQLIQALVYAERGEPIARVYQLMKRSGWGTSWDGDETVAKALSEGLRWLGEEKVADEVDEDFEKMRNFISRRHWVVH